MKTYLAIDATSPNLKLSVYQTSSKHPDPILIKSLLSHTGKQLTDQLISKIKSIVDLDQIDGIVLRDKIGSFTGIRIAGVLTNTWHYYSKQPVISANGPDWIEAGITQLDNVKLEKGYLEPEYQTAPNITVSKRHEPQKDS
ncbi:hypothetical protein H6792_01180 [Candidatus Nomurabacteria bacterium]|nr:hypothetical protein [Candidatus Nomurabacteria bacterium]